MPNSNPNMLAVLPRPAIFAHRGASLYAPENTLAAFRLAIQQGADAIEMDAKLSKDGYVVIIHDQTLDRTTGVQGRVGEMLLSDIRKLDAGSHFSPAFRGEPIPTLEEVLAEFGEKTYYNIELTNYASLNDNLPEKVTALVQAYRLSDHVLFSSFNPLALLRARRKLPRVPIALLSLPGKKGKWARSWLGNLLSYHALHIALQDISPALIAKAHSRRKRVHVFTVNREEEMRDLIKLEIDGFFTDDPSLARKVISSYSNTTWQA